MKFLLIDYDDSFSYNIASQFYELGVIVTIINYRKINSIDIYSDDISIIFGPGPGNTEDYPESLIFINNILDRANITILGICLGHQLIFAALGVKVSLSSNKIHGQSTALRIPNWPIFENITKLGERPVQRYNSWCIHRKDMTLSSVKTVFLNDELMISQFSNVLTYQFHPESIGTSNQLDFFKAFIKFRNNLQATDNL